jgi:ATP-binding cassette subfamily A (ABC1) protein 3
MGYCPQQNLIFDAMTVDEHLKFYVMIKGIPKDKR